MKYCSVATPFKGVRVYTRFAMGKPSSGTCLEELMSRVLGYVMQEGCVAKFADALYVHSLLLIGAGPCNLSTTRTSDCESVIQRADRRHAERTTGGIDTLCGPRASLNCCRRSMSVRYWFNPLTRIIFNESLRPELATNGDELKVLALCLVLPVAVSAPVCPDIRRRSDKIRLSGLLSFARVKSVDRNHQKAASETCFVPVYGAEYFSVSAYC